jgi:Xaa-Pro aminopeptidase
VDHVTRRARLAERLPALGIDAVLITRLPNVRYLTGFTGSAGSVLVGAAGAVFFTDGRYGERSRHEVPDLDRVVSMDPPAPSILDRCRRMGIERLGYERHAVTVARLEEWRDALEGVELVGVGEEVERLRWEKDPDELALLRAAQEATDAAFDELLDALAVGVSERQVATDLERAIARLGADGPAFPSIVAFGEHAAEPHHRPCHRTLAEGDAITLDFGALVDGYHTDMTRTVAFGAPTPELSKVHDVVTEAQQAGVDAVRAGARGRDVDAAARSVIADAGYGERFSHGLGHGVGLEIHEGPWLGTRSEDELPVGAVVTVEPGIYLPGIGGVRIEDSVEVTGDGGRPLGVASRELIEL